MPNRNSTIPKSLFQKIQCRIVSFLVVFHHCMRQIESFSVVSIVTAPSKPTGNRTTAARAVSSTPLEDVVVWDNVLSPEIRNTLHKAACQTGLGHRAFSRPLSPPQPSSSTPSTTTNDDYHQTLLIEQTLDRLLSQLKDNSKYVEYWTRQEWRSIEAHADVDEFLAKRQDRNPTPTNGDSGGGGEEEETPLPFRYPNAGHVLYLQIGSDVRGPTCVFPNYQSGGSLLRRRTNTITTQTKDDGKNSKKEDEEEDGGGSSGDGVELITVPAVPSRLLRFHGSYLHAVPRPTDLWFLSFVMGAEQYDPVEQWGRSVVLFNTWGDVPPEGLGMDKEEDVRESGDSEDSALENEAVDPKVGGTGRSRSQWTVAFSRQSDVLEEDEGESTHTTAIDDGTTTPLTAKIWLLGNERRRDHPLRTIKLYADEGVREALKEETVVRRRFLRRPS